MRGLATCLQGGMDKCLEQVRQIIEYPLQHPELFQHLGVEPPRGVLFRGPPGTGKTLLAEAIAGSLADVTFYKVCGTEIVSGVTGESEMRLRMLFEKAFSTEPSIIFIDEIDAIAPKREGGTGRSGGMEKRIVAQLLTCMDNISTRNVIVLGATNRADAIDPALRRAGRFDREVLIGVPDEEARCQILIKITRSMRLEGNFNFSRIAKLTPGYVGADLRALTKEAAVIAINRIFKETGSDKANKTFSSGRQPLLLEDVEEGKDAPSVIPLTPEQMDPLYIIMDDFLEAIKHVQPSSKREGFATVPDVTWDNIGALESIREELALSVIEPIRHPERFKELGLPLPAGVMLYGPPGCGKTLLAKAIASQSGANFISVKGPELLDKYVGESERAVRRVFERAKASCPCIVFFDELDSLCPRRGGSSESSSGGGGVSERVVNQLLTEMDGLESRRSVFVIAATNRPELIDPAMMRPGRLDKLLYVPLPTPDDRASILKALSANVNLSSDVNVEELAKSKRADGFSGADCAALLREAGLAVLRDHALDRIRRRENNSGGDGDKKPLQITRKHFDYAFDHVMPSVSKADQKKYDKMRDQMARARSRSRASLNMEKEEDGDSSIIGASHIDNNQDRNIS